MYFSETGVVRKNSSICTGSKRRQEQVQTESTVRKTLDLSMQKVTKIYRQFIWTYNDFAIWNLHGLEGGGAGEKNVRTFSQTLPTSSTATHTTTHLGAVRGRFICYAWPLRGGMLWPCLRLLLLLPLSHTTITVMLLQPIHGVLFTRPHRALGRGLAVHHQPCLLLGGPVLLFPLLCAGGRDEVVGGDGGVLPRGVLLVPLVLWPGGGVGRCLTALSRGLAAVLLFSRAFAIRS